MAAASTESAKPAEFHSISAPTDTRVYNNIIYIHIYVAMVYTRTLYTFDLRGKVNIILYLHKYIV